MRSVSRVINARLPAKKRKPFVDSVNAEVTAVLMAKKLVLEARKTDPEDMVQVLDDLYGIRHTACSPISFSPVMIFLFSSLGITETTKPDRWCKSAPTQPAPSCGLGLAAAYRAP